MLIKIFLAVCLLIREIFGEQITVNEPETGIFMVRIHPERDLALHRPLVTAQGEMDKFSPELGNQRILNRYNSTTDTFVVDPDTRVNIDLGVSDWGSFQTSFLMTKYPKGFKNPGKFCSLVRETLSYTVKAVENVAEGDYNFIYDNCIFENKLFIMTGNGQVMGYEIQVNGTNVPSFKPLYSKPLDSPLVVTMEVLKSEFEEAGIAFSDPTNTLYIATDINLIALDVKTGQSSIVDTTIYIGEKNIVYVDYSDGYLFVAFETKGIFIYDVKVKGKEKLVGAIDGSYWLHKNIKIKDFNIHDYDIEFVDNNPSLLNKSVGEDSFYGLNFTNYERNNYIKNKVLDRRLLLIAESTGIYLLDLNSLFEQGVLSQNFHRHYIGVKNPLIIERFHDVMYVLVQDPIDPNQQTVVEFFITDKDFANWDSITTTNQLFRVNRQIEAMNITSIFVDEDFLYVSSGNEHYFYERGINSTFLKSTASISSKLSSSVIYGFEKIIINGDDYLMLIGEKEITLDAVRMNTHTLKCPNSQNWTNFEGAFEFQLNTTTRNCPEKIRQNLSQNDKFSKVCVFSRDFKVIPNSALIRTTKDLILMILGIILIFSGIVIIVLIVANKVMEKNMDRMKYEYEQLSSQQGGNGNWQGSNNMNTTKPDEEPEGSLNSMDIGGPNSKANMRSQKTNVIHGIYDAGLDYEKDDDDEKAQDEI